MGIERGKGEEEGGDFQRLQISLHAAGGVPRRRTVDATARQVCDCVCVLNSDGP